MRTAGSGGSSISAQHELLARWLEPAKISSRGNGPQSQGGSKCSVWAFAKTTWTCTWPEPPLYLLVGDSCAYRVNGYIAPSYWGSRSRWTPALEFPARAGQAVAYGSACSDFETPRNSGRRAPRLPYWLCTCAACRTTGSFTTCLIPSTKPRRSINGSTDAGFSLDPQMTASESGVWIRKVLPELGE